MMDVKSNQTEKWMLTEYEFSACLSSIREIESIYSTLVFKKRDDITRREAQDEFWKRVSEFYGFTIKFNRDVE